MKKTIFLLSILFVCMIVLTSCVGTKPEEVVLHVVTVDGVQQQVIDGQKAVRPEDPSMPGYTFIGWMCDGQEYQWDAPVKKDLVINSQWEDDVQEDKVKVDKVSMQVTAGESVAESVWNAEYSADGMTFNIHVTDDYLYTNSSDKGMNDNVEIVLQSIPSIRYDTTYTFDFLINANGDYWFKRANGQGSFGADGAYDLFVKEGENLIIDFKLTENGYDVSVFFRYDLLNTTYSEAFGNIRFCPSMRNSFSDSLSAWDSFKDYTCTWTRPMNFLVLDEEGFMTIRPTSTPDLESAFNASELYQEGKPLLDNLAQLRPEGEGQLARADVGEDAFSDRFYGFDPSAMPSSLIGLSYVRDSINGYEVTVEKAGYVIMLAPHSGYPSLIYQINADNWTRIYEKGTSIASTTPGGSVLTELADYYVKWCEAGDKISYEKYTILFCAPLADGEYYEHPSITEPAEFLTDFNGYEELTRNWQGVTSIEVTDGGRLYASWVSGDNGEPRAGNYDVIVYSDDGGKTWNDLWIIDHPNELVKINDAQLWKDPDGKLWIFYCQSKTGNTFDRTTGVWCVTVDDPDAQQPQHSEPRRLFNGLLRNNITVLSDGTWLAFPNDFVDDTNTIVYASVDKGQTWQIRGGAYAPQAYNFDETMAVELTDGRLWMLIRNSSGKLLESYSEDGGYTWTDAVYTDIVNPCSRFYIDRLPSGNLILINNNTASGRDKMTAFISEDDGKTWKYQCLLDDRPSTTYPDAGITDDGVIYAIWDQGRLEIGNIVLAVFDEEDVKRNSVLPTDQLSLISTLDSHVDQTQGETLGDGSIFMATGGFDASSDDGSENAEVTQRGQNSQYIYFKGESSKDFYVETELRAMSVVNKDAYPKFGIVVRTETKQLFFYIDGQRVFNKYTVGIVTGTNSTWDWENSKEVPANVEYADRFVKLAVLRMGNEFVFYVNGRAVIEQSDISGFTDQAVDVGFLTFNSRVIFRNYLLEKDSARLEAIASAQPPRTSVLYFGDSFVDMYHWETFFEDVNDADAVNVGIGGTKVQQWIDNFDDFILRYNPEKVVMHIGINDINAGTSGEKVASLLEELFALFAEKLPDTEIYFISVSPCVNHWGRHDQVDVVNDLVKAMREENAKLHFIDLASELYNDDKSFVRSELYSDGLHLNEKGYEIWSRVIKQALYEENQETQQ